MKEYLSKFGETFTYKNVDSLTFDYGFLKPTSVND